MQGPQRSRERTANGDGEERGTKVSYLLCRFAPLFPPGWEILDVSFSTLKRSTSPVRLLSFNISLCCVELPHNRHPHRRQTVRILIARKVDVEDHQQGVGMEWRQPIRCFVRLEMIRPESVQVLASFTGKDAFRHMFGKPLVVSRDNRSRWPYRCDVLAVWARCKIQQISHS